MNRWPDDRHRDELDDPLVGYRAGTTIPEPDIDPRYDTGPTVPFRFACMDPDLVEARRRWWQSPEPRGHYPGCRCTSCAR